MRLYRTFASSLLLSTLALTSCSSSSDSASQLTEPTTSANSPAVTTAVSALVVRPVLQVAVDDPAAATSSVATAPGTAILTDRSGYAYLVGSFDTQDGIFSKDGMASPTVVDGVTSWSVVISVLNEAAWSEISKACSVMSSSCPTGRVAFIADGRVVLAPDFSGEVYELSGTVELRGFANEVEAREAAFWLFAND